MNWVYGLWSALLCCSLLAIHMISRNSVENEAVTEVTTVPAVFEHASKSCTGTVKTITVKSSLPADYRMSMDKKYPYTAECSNGLTISATITVKQ